MKWLSLIFFMIFTSLASASSFSYPPPKAKQATIGSSTLRLGDGYLSYDHISMGESALRMEGTQVSYEGIQSSINLNQTIERIELARNLNIDLSATGGWGNYSASASANYLNHIENTRYSENFTYAQRYYAMAILDVSHLPTDQTALNQIAGNDYHKNGIKTFADHYGDSFIKELPMGAFLIVNLRINFASAFDKERFDTNLIGGIGSIFNAGVRVQHAIESSNAKGVIEISALQLGGDPLGLAGIFSKKADGGYYITTCSLENLKDCQGTIDGIIRYAQTDFSKQIKTNKNQHEKPEGNIVVVGEPVLTTYSSRFFLLPTPPLDEATIMDRLDMANLYQNTKNTKRFFDHFLASPAAAHLTQGANQLLTEIQAKFAWNLGLFDQFSAINCYMPGEENTCSSIIAKIKGYKKDIDTKVIDYYMNHGFYEISSTCNYVPVGLPDEINQNYAIYCAGQWLDGAITFKMSEDKRKIDAHGDWNNMGHHIKSCATLTANDSYQNYSGLANFFDLTTGLWKLTTLSLQMTQNKV